MEQENLEKLARDLGIAPELKRIFDSDSQAYERFEEAVTGIVNSYIQDPNSASPIRVQRPTYETRTRGTQPFHFGSTMFCYLSSRKERVRTGSKSKIIWPRADEIKLAMNVFATKYGLPIENPIRGLPSATERRLLEIAINILAQQNKGDIFYRTL